MRVVVRCVYTCVVDNERCPSNSCTARKSAPLSSRCVANECRSVWGEIDESSPAWSKYLLNLRRTDRVEIRPPSRLMKSGDCVSPPRPTRSRIAIHSLMARSACDPSGTIRSRLPLPRTIKAWPDSSTSPRLMPTSSLTRMPVEYSVSKHRSIARTKRCGGVRCR